MTFWEFWSLWTTLGGSVVLFASCNFFLQQVVLGWFIVGPCACWFWSQKEIFSRRRLRFWTLCSNPRSRKDHLMHALVDNQMFQSHNALDVKRTWAISNKKRNKAVHSLRGNHRVVNVNLGRKGIKVLRKLSRELDPDVMVVTEPGNLGARPQVKGFDLIRHKSIAILTRSKTVQVNSHEPLWLKLEKDHDTDQVERLRNDEKSTARTVRFENLVDEKGFDPSEPVKELSGAGSPSKKRLICEKHQDRMRDERILKTSIRLGGVTWSIISLYGPQRADPDRKVFWEKLNSIVTEPNSPVSDPALLIGDLNALASEEEAHGLTSAKTLVVPFLKKWEDHGRLSDLWKIHSKEKGITRFKDPSSDDGSRIDRILLSSRARKVVKRSYARVGERASDHAPLIWDFLLVSDADWRPVIAQDNSQLNWGDWNEKTSQNWNDWVAGQSFLSTSMLTTPPVERCHRVEEFVRKGWQKIYQLIGVGRKIIRLSKNKKRALKGGNVEAARKVQEKIKADIRTKILRKKRGEGNKEIFSVKDDQGKWLEGTNLEEFIAKNLQHFGFRNPHEDGWGENRKKLSEEDKSFLNQPPTIEEVRMVIQRMKKKKACLKNDLPGWVLKDSGEQMLERFWEIIDTIWTHPQEIPKEWTRTMIRLVPKKGRDLSSLAAWRPIAVGTTIHKIVFTIWTKRLEKIALKNEWLHPCQFGFVKGRTAKGASDVANSLIDKLKAPVVLQWDIEKAFPSVSPEAVCQMLRKLEVPEGFCSILSSFYTDSQSMAFVSGLPGGHNGKCFWTNEWGLKQGCPASPLLLNLWTFPIVAEMAKQIDFLQYADDMWAFVETKDEEHAKSTMRRLVDAAGLVVNEEKVKRWTPASPECLMMMGMIIREGNKETVSSKTDNVLGPSLMRGVERELVGWKKVAYINTVVIPRLRHLLSTFWSTKIFKETKDIDEVLRGYCKCHEWPVNVSNDFLSDSVLGVGLLSLEEEVAKDLICYVWRREGQGPRVAEIWKDAWARFQAGGSPQRVILWKEAVEMFTDMDVLPELYQGSRGNNPFPLGKGGHFHQTRIAQVFQPPPRDLFEKNRCLEAWESLRNPNALRVWTDASVANKGSAAAVLVESGAPIVTSPLDPANRILTQRVHQKVEQLGQKLVLSHIDKHYDGRVQGSCAVCNKPFDVFIRTFLSRGPTKCDCKAAKLTIGDRVREKAAEMGNLEILNTDGNHQGKVQGRCLRCQKSFDVYIRTFLDRGPTKCHCSPTSVPGPDEKTFTPQQHLSAPDCESHREIDPNTKGRHPVFPPSTLFSFPVRGNSFRSEGLGLLGAKRLLAERGNLEMKEELHFLCDNQAAVYVNCQMQKDLSITPGHFIYKNNAELELALLRQWKVVKYIFVKGHIGVPQNEACDARARHEVERCTERIAEEVLETFGDVRNRGMRIESRKELEKPRAWMKDFQTDLMKCCRSRMARRVQIGVERWKGNISDYQEADGRECAWCLLTHGATFTEMMRECPKFLPFRQATEERWKAVLKGEKFDEELLFGRVRRTLFQKSSQKKALKGAWSEFVLALRWWERRLKTLRKDLGEHTENAVEDEAESEEEDQKNHTEVAEMAKEIRVMDEGIVQRGEPDVLMMNNKQHLRRFFSRRKSGN